MGAGEVDFHTEPFGDAAKLRASFGGYESAFTRRHAAEPTLLAQNERTCTLLLYGPATTSSTRRSIAWPPLVFPDHVGPFLLRDCGHFVPWEAPHALVSGTALLQRPAAPAR